MSYPPCRCEIVQRGTSKTHHLGPGTSKSSPPSPTAPDEMKIWPGRRTGSPTPKLARTLQALGSTIHKTILATFKFSTAEDQASTLDLNGSDAWSSAVENENAGHVLIAHSWRDV